MKYCHYCGASMDNKMIYCPRCGNTYYDEDQDYEDQTYEQQDYGINTAYYDDSDEWYDSDSTLDSITPVRYERSYKEKETRRQPRKRKRRRKTPRLVFVCILVIAILGVLVFTLISRKELTPRRIAAIEQSVLILYVYDENDELYATGSGFVVGDGNTLVTN